MSEKKLIDKLTELRSLPAENEVVEFKEAKNDYHFDKIGKYFSALSNEANLKNKPEGWLVFGVENKRKDIVGSNYRYANRAALDSLKAEIANKTTNRITFIEIYELILPKGRVIMFQIPAAPKGMPVAWEGHYYGRDGEELHPLNIDELERIRRQAGYNDWSAEIVAEATLNDLDDAALAIAKENYRKKNPRIAADIDGWSNENILIKSHVIVQGKLTHTALLLFGKKEAASLLRPAQVQMSWVLYTREKVEKDYEHFYPPYILAIDQVYAKIRNLKYRYMKEGTLFPEEVDQYDQVSIKEALSNCIAHRDYVLGGRITIAENEDGYLSFTNPGSFIPGSVENVILSEDPPHFYRNSLLAETMVAYNMIDTIGSGIKKMFRTQKEKFFPMPEYDLTANKVKVTLIGKVLDVEYAKVLAKNPDLTLTGIMMLDKVQKKKMLNDDEARQLKAKGLIEGRKPNFFISASLAQTTGQKADYTRKKAFRKQDYFDWIIKALKDHHSLSRKDIEELVWDKLSDLYNPTQKKTKVTNLISELRKNGTISNTGSDAVPCWVLTNKSV